MVVITGNSPGRKCASSPAGPPLRWRRHRAPGQRRTPRRSAASARFRRIPRRWALFGKKRSPPALPLRAELLSLESLEERARSLAAAYRLRPPGHGGRKDVTGRLEENGRVLAAAYRELAEDVHQGLTVEPAADWLLDNFHLLREQAKTLVRDLPPRYYRSLPKLAARDNEGRARVHETGDRPGAPWRRPGRARPADPFRVRLPDGGSAHPGRVVGAAQHAQAGPDREPADPGRRLPGPARASGGRPTATSSSSKAAAACPRCRSPARKIHCLAPT